MAQIDFDYFYKQLQLGCDIDETCFSVIGSDEYSWCYLGYLPEYEKPYWFGLVPDGSQAYDFSNAEELVNAKVFNRKSLKEIWDDINIHAIGGVDISEWFKYFDPNFTSSQTPT